MDHFISSSLNRVFSFRKKSIKTALHTIVPPNPIVKALEGKNVDSGTFSWVSHMLTSRAAELAGVRKSHLTFASATEGVKNLNWKANV